VTNRPVIPAAKPIIGDEERAAVDRVMRSGMVAHGPEVAAFEEEFSAALAGGRQCVAVNSGTSGLHLGLLGAGIGPGDEVIVPSFTFAATANSVALTGATPVFADIEPDSFCLDPAAVEAAVTERTKAIMPVHLYGHPADMTGLAAVAQRHGLVLFEDAAQAHGATFDGRPVGTFGVFGMFSLYPTKNMTSGEGGMVSCDEDVAHRIRLLRNQGMAKQYANELVGFNNRMTDIHAAIGRVQLTKLPGWTEDRRRNAAFLDAHLENVVVPPVREGSTHVYHQYTIRVAGRDAFADRLAERGVGSAIYYPVPVHRQKPFIALGYGDNRFPVTERLTHQVLSIPVHPSLTDDEVATVIGAVNETAAELGPLEAAAAG
jgi:perosamine synthetase